MQFEESDDEDKHLTPQNEKKRKTLGGFYYKSYEHSN